MGEHETSTRIARFCIWTLRWQRYLAFHLRVFTWLGTGVVLFLALAGQIAFETALHSIVISLFAIATLVWFLIRARRTSLLHIEDPALRSAAHEAMILLIRSRALSAADKRLLQRHFGDRHCEMGHCRW